MTKIERLKLLYPEEFEPSTDDLEILKRDDFNVY